MAVDEFAGNGAEMQALAMLEHLEGIVHFADGFSCYHSDGPAGKALREWINGARPIIDDARSCYGSTPDEIIMSRSSRPAFVSLHAEVAPMRSINPSASHSETSHAGATSEADTTTSSGAVDSSSNFRSCSGVIGTSSASSLSKHSTKIGRS